MAKKAKTSQRVRRPARGGYRDRHTETPVEHPANTSSIQSPRGEAPKRILCSVTDGPEGSNFFGFFPSAVLPGGHHAFHSKYEISYQGQTGTYLTCVKIIKHRNDGNSYNIGGYIYIRLPGEKKNTIHRFTGQYALKSHSGHLRIYVAPCELKTVGLF